MKRKIDSINEQEDAVKRLKLTDSSGSKTPPEPEPVTTSDSLPLLETEIVPNANEGKGEDMEEPETEEPEGRSKPQDQSKAHQRRRINKLVPPRPFPTVPTSVSATGPRSNHKEGKNLICITRKTSLSCYIRRCKDVIIQDGYKILHLTAMGAAIPLLLQLICALPPILPFPQDEIHTEVTTGTVEVQDEVLPQNDDDEITYETRSKSTLRIVLKIGDGLYEGDKKGSRKYAGGKGGGKASGPSRTGGKKGKAKETSDDRPAETIFEEPEQEYMDML